VVTNGEHISDDVLGLRGRPVLVVGGGAGIGRATVLLLARAGAHIAVADIDESRAAVVRDEAATQGAKAVALGGDVTTPEGAAEVVDGAHDALGGLVAVCNIVGLASWMDLLSLDVATWERDIRMNLSHHLFVGQAAARHMIADGTGGNLAFVASVSGLYGAPNHAAYGAAKAGAMALARSMANEWAHHNIRVNCVAPDIIATPRVVAGFEEQGRGVTDMDAIAAADGVPMARWGRPEEIAGPLVFCVSALSGFMTGQTLVVDGGTRARFPHGGPKPFGED
jgi:3-oxoacyl-[acyl-carrier protein] reductase